MFSTYAPRHARPVANAQRRPIALAIALIPLCLMLFFDANTAGAETLTAGIIRTAVAQQGVPYKYGGSPQMWNVKSATNTKCGPTNRCTFDCSSLVQYSFERHGIPVPRTTAEQWNAGKKVKYADRRAGDIVFFSDQNRSVAGITHVGILIGNGLMVEAPHTGANVRVTTYKDRPGIMPYVVRLT